MTEPITIIVADDHPIFRHGLVAVIRKSAGLEIVAEAENGLQAVELVAAEKPDVAVLDVDMPVMDGIEAARRISEIAPETQIVFLTMHRDRNILRSMKSLGVLGYVLKDAAMHEIDDCIRTVVAGDTYLSPLVGSLMPGESQSTDDAGVFPALETLTKGERRVLKLIAESRTNREIATDLYVSVRTVETHRYNICTKLDLNGPHALFKFANKNKRLILSLADE